MHEAGSILDSGSVCRRVGTVEREVELEVREFLLDFREVLEVECLHERAGSVEEADLASCLEGLEQVHDVAAQGSHTGTAADEDVFEVLGVVLGEQELSVGTAYDYLVTWLARKHIRRRDSGRDGQELGTLLPGYAAVERRRRDTHVELYDILLGRIRGHGVCPYRGLRVHALEVEEAVLLPVLPVFRIYVDVLEVYMERRNVDLDVLAALELDVLAFGQPHGELLDEGRHVLVGDYLAFELLDRKRGLRDLYLQVVLDLDLAAEAPAVLDLLAVEESYLGGKYLSAALEHLYLALAAVGLAAAGGGKEDLLVRERGHQAVAGRHVENLLAVVDVYLYRALGSDRILDYKEQHHEEQGDDYDYRYCRKNCCTHISILLLKLNSHENHECKAHETDGDEGHAYALEGLGHVAVAHLLAYRGEADYGEVPAYSRTEGVGYGLAAVHEIPLLHEERASEDRTVNGDQRQEDTQRRVEVGHELFDYHLDELGECCHHGDEDDQGEEAEVHVCELRAEPGECAGRQHILVEQIVDGQGEHQHENYGEAEAVGCLDILRYRQI